MTDLFPAGFFDFNPHPACLIRVELDHKGKPVDWTFLQCNDALARLEGLPKSRLVGCRFFSIFPNGSRKWLKPYHEAAWKNHPASFDKISEEVGQYLHIDVFPAGVRGCCVCLLRDIKAEVAQETARRRELESAVAKLEHIGHLNEQVRRYSTAMGILYTLAISLDLSGNRYEMIEYASFTSKTAARSGTMDELIDAGVSTVSDPVKAQEFRRVFSRLALIKAFRDGQKEVML